MQTSLHVVLWSAAALVGGCSEAAEPCGPERAVVTRIIDGDTVELATGERVRYLLTDAPEISRGEPECYGAQARERNRALVQGREVVLRYDRECTDKYGRLLAYVSADGRDVNATLVEEGYACVLHIPPNGAARMTEFEERAERARWQGRGLWSACDERCR